MGKGMIPKKGYNDKLYHNNYDGIAWPSKKKERKKCGCGRTKDTDGYCDGSHSNKE